MKPIDWNAKASYLNTKMTKLHADITNFGQDLDNYINDYQDAVNSFGPSSHEDTKTLQQTSDQFGLVFDTFRREWAKHLQIYRQKI